MSYGRFRENICEKSTFSGKYFRHFVLFQTFGGRFKDFKSWNRILQDLLLTLMAFKVFLGPRKAELKIFEKNNFDRF